MADLVTNLLLNNKNFNDNIATSTMQIRKFKAQSEAAGAGVQKVLSNAGAGGASSLFSTLSKGGGMAFAGITAATSAAMAFTEMLKTSVESAKNFGHAMSELQSLTGLAGQSLEYLRNKSIELSDASTNSAKDVVDAYKVIGSQMPVLLKDKEGLSEVTKQTILLSEASGLDMATSTQAVTTALNQYGVSAGHASEYVNILAAAAQQGSAEIPYLQVALEKSGGAASSVGVKFNELVASIEAIAPKMSQPEEAGTALRNIFLTLEASTDKGLKPSIVGFTKSLENLAAKQYSTTDLMNMFGKRSVTAALALIKAKTEAINFSTSIEGTNQAMSQAEINTNDFKGSVEELENKWTNFMLKINGSDGALKIITDDLGYMLSLITNMQFPDLGWFNNVLNLVEKIAKYTTSIGSTIRILEDLHESFESEKNVISSVNNMLTTRTKLLKDTGKFTKQGVSQSYLQLIAMPKFKNLPEARKQLKDWYNTSIRSINEDNAPKVKISDDNKLGGGTKKAKTLLEQYEDELKKLEGKKEVEIQAGMNTSKIDKQISALQSKINNLKLNMIDKSTLDGLEKEKNVLQEMQKYSKNNKEYKTYQTKIDNVDKTIASIQGVAYIHLDKGSIADMKKQISDIDEEISNTTNIKTKIDLTVKKEDLEDSVKNAEQLLEPISKPIRKQIKVDEKFDFENDKSKEGNLKDQYEIEKDYLKDMNDYNKEAGTNFKFTNTQIEKQTEKVTALKNEYLSAHLSDTVKKYKKELTGTTYDGITSSISSIANLGKTWVGVGKNLEHGFDGFLQILNAITSTVSSIKEVIATITEVEKVTKALTTAQNLQSASEKAAAVSAVTSATTSATADTVATQTKLANDSEKVAANTSVAATGAAASVAGIPLVGIGLAVAGVAAMLALFGGLPKFATGGVIGGGSYSGDNMLARVNSGEMILNGSQQSNLFKAINQGSLGGGGSMNTTVTHVIKGSELKLIINNDLRSKGKTLIGQ